MLNHVLAVLIILTGSIVIVVVINTIIFPVIDVVSSTVEDLLYDVGQYFKNRKK